MVTVEFVDIGKRRMCWTQELKSFSALKVLNALRESPALDKAPDVMWGADGKSGTVWVNGVSYAGKFRVVEVSDPTPLS